MRLFTAVDIAEPVAQAALEMAERLRARLARQAPRARVSWIVDGRIHLTVVFMGEVDEARAVQVADALRPSLSCSPFRVSVGGLGAFPPRGAPRVLWAGIRIGRERLLELEREVRTRLGTAVALEERPYRPHLTLGRVREPGGLRAATLFDGLERADLGSFDVGAITLFESRLSPRGSTYLALQRTALGGAGNGGRHAADA